MERYGGNRFIHTLRWIGSDRSDVGANNFTGNSNRAGGLDDDMDCREPPYDKSEYQAREARSTDKGIPR